MAPSPTYPQQDPDRFASDVMLIADLGNVRPGAPTLTVALRGMANIVVEVRTLASAKHSGMYGGAAPDALLALMRALVSLHDDSGDVAVAGLRRNEWTGGGPDEAEFRELAEVVDGAPLMGTGTLGSRVWTGPAIPQDPKDNQHGLGRLRRDPDRCSRADRRIRLTVVAARGADPTSPTWRPATSTRGSADRLDGRRERRRSMLSCGAVRRTSCYPAGAVAFKGRRHPLRMAPPCRSCRWVRVTADHATTRAHRDHERVDRARRSDSRSI